MARCTGPNRYQRLGPILLQQRQRFLESAFLIRAWRSRQRRNARALCLSDSGFTNWGSVSQALAFRALDRARCALCIFDAEG